MPNITKLYFVVLIGATAICSCLYGMYEGPGDYFVEVSPSDRHDIFYIIDSLANKSLFSLLFMKSELTAARERVSHLHTMKFLLVIFTNSQMKRDFGKLARSGGIGWDGFVDGIKKNLSKETRLHNITPSHISDFAYQTGINRNLIYEPLTTGQWDTFLNVLINESGVMP